jgi:hypothetical protein
MVDVRKLTDDIPADLRNEAATETYPPSPVDRSQKTLTDGSPVTPDHRDLQPSGQQKGYVVRSPTSSAAPAARRPARAGDRRRSSAARMDLVCVNHWDRAIETHKRMHPEARHYCQDVASARPIECVPEGRLDLLMASPTCTYHSRARGGRPTSDQQRMDPWHVVTWLTELRVERLLVENVPEFVDWGPVDPRTGKPIKAQARASTSASGSPRSRRWATGSSTRS